MGTPLQRKRRNIEKNDETPETEKRNLPAFFYDTPQKFVPKLPNALQEAACRELPVNNQNDKKNRPVRKSVISSVNSFASFISPSKPNNKLTRSSSFKENTASTSIASRG